MRSRQRQIRMKEDQRQVSFSALLLSALIVLSLTGCSIPGMVIGVGATAGIAAAEERGVEKALDDLKIDLEIKRRLVAFDDTLITKISTEVFEGRVLLTGTAKDDQERLEIGRLAWGVTGVAEVINEVRASGDSSLLHASKDILISTELRARMMGDGNVSAINYNIETVRGTIYLLGIAQSDTELQRVLNHARNVSGVRNIVPLVRVKTPHGQNLAVANPESAI